ncbi:hypothetical protein B0H13DRAFT_1660678 [Mycena leptocephala]|nr:hypothetical protein B0H13DRAFT_1660678 [Mycena leptocephala]
MGHGHTKAHHTAGALRDFTSKHRPTLNETAVRALNVFVDPSRGEHDLLMIKLKPRLYSTVVPVDVFPMAEDMRGQLKQIKEDDKRFGTVDALLVVEVTDTKSINVVPAPILKCPPPSLPQPKIRWEHMLKIMLNNGLVVVLSQP